MANPAAQFSRQDKGYLGHYLRELRAKPQAARANFAILVGVLSGPGRYLLCALEPAALLTEALAALPYLERTAFNYGLAEALSPEEATRAGVEPETTKQELCLMTLAQYQAELRAAAEEELKKLQGSAA